ncbi:hypothetical protein SHAb15599_00100 [Acinetobacter phage SH-Ab 15599]|nr:hypothetical protein SHAb15599_00100 [Acinetobacter phage SH-Ab 15599]
MDMINQFNKKINSLGLHRSGIMYAGTSIMSECTDSSIKFFSNSQKTLDTILEKVGFNENAKMGEGFLLYEFKDTGMKRIELPQLEIDKFVADLKKYDIAIENGEMDASELTPSQNEFNDKKVKAIIEAKSWKKKQIIISEDHFVIDGHHRWKAALESKDMVSTLKVMKSRDDILKFVKGKEYAAYKRIDEALVKNISAPYNAGRAYIFKKSCDDGTFEYQLQIVTADGVVVDNDYFNLLDKAVAHAKDYGIEFDSQDVGCLR